MPMRFKRGWDFNQGNRNVDLNSITQDNEVRAAVLELLGSVANDPEFIRDTIAATLVQGSNVSITPNDAGDIITIAATDTNTTDPEVVRDTIAAALVQGSGVTITPNDAGDTITIAASGTTDPEVVRDTMAAALVQGAGITITPNDAGDTITIAATGGSTKTLNTQTASYTLAITDAGAFVRMNVATANTLTVPPNSAVAFPVGTVVEGVQTGAGQTTITPGAGVTINASPGLKTAAQYATFGLLKVATDTWLAYGRLSA